MGKRQLPVNDRKADGEGGLKKTRCTQNLVVGEKLMLEQMCQKFI